MSIAEALPALGAVVVALIVGFLTGRRELKGRQTQRLFEFVERRENLYVSFIESMNAAIGEYWKLRASGHVSSGIDGNQKALDLDTAHYKIRLVAPQSVVDACAQVNGAVQMSFLDIGRSDVIAGPKHLEIFEEAKLEMIDAMRKDLFEIENSGDGTIYETLKYYRSR